MCALCELFKMIFSSEDQAQTDCLGHRIADWEDQIKKGVEDVLVRKSPSL